LRELRGGAGVVLFASVVLPHKCVRGSGIDPITEPGKVVEYDKVKGGLFFVAATSIKPPFSLREYISHDVAPAADPTNTEFLPLELQLALRVEEFRLPVLPSGDCPPQGGFYI